MTALTDQQIKALKCPEPPAPQETQTEDCCEAELKVIACCKHDDIPRLRTRTVVYQPAAGPGTSVANNALATLNALEANGWLVLGHSVVEELPAGGQVAGQRSWLISLGYYA